MRFWKEINCEHERVQACAVVWDTSTSYKNIGSLNQNMCKRRKSTQWKHSAMWENGASRGKRETLSTLQIERKNASRSINRWLFTMIPVVNNGVSAGVSGSSKLLWGRLKARYQWFLPKGASWCPQGNSAHLLLWNEINLGVYPMKARLVLTFEDQYGSPYQQIKKEKAWDHLKTQKKTFDKV